MNPKQQWRYGGRVWCSWPPTHCSFLGFCNVMWCFTPAFIGGSHPVVCTLSQHLDNRSLVQYYVLGLIKWLHGAEGRYTTHCTVEKSLIWGWGGQPGTEHSWSTYPVVRSVENRKVTRMYSRVFLHWPSPKKLKYGKPRLGESTLTLTGLTFLHFKLLRGGPV